MLNKNFINNFFDVIKECLDLTKDISDDDKTYKIFIEKLNNFFKNNTTKSFNFEDSIKKYALNMISEEYQDILKFDIENEVVDVKMHLNLLRDALSIVGINDKYEEEKLKNYLKVYVDFSKKILNKNNKGLDITLYRNSKLIKNMYKIGRIPFNKAADKNIYYQTMYSPYTMCAIMEIIKDTMENRKDLSKEPLLRDLRYNLFLDMERKKFESINSYSYSNLSKTFLTDDFKEIVSMPIYDLSSIEPINPIILFDYIKTHIIERLEDETNLNNDHLNINICTVGSVETANYENKKTNTEMHNLLDSIIGWYNRNYDMPKLDLNIISLVNKNDIFQNEETIESITNGNRAITSIKKHNFYDLAFSSIEIQDLISKNDITFLLDPAFISYSIKFSYGFNHVHINAVKDLNPIKFEDMDTLNGIYTSCIYDNAPIKKIVRNLDDNCLRTLFSKIKSDKNHTIKDLYINTSKNNHMLDYSMLGSYVLSKDGIYNGNIFQFSKCTNKKEQMLEYSEKSNINFKVSIWALFKNISISYLFSNIKDIIDKNINTKSLSYEKYMEIFNDIYFDIEGRNHYSPFNVSLRFTEEFDNLLLNELNVSNKSMESIKNRIHKDLSAVFKPLFEECIFSDNPIDKNIRQAFCYSLYDSAQDVNSMHFLHYYKLLNLKGEGYPIYSAKFSTEYPKENLNVDNKTQLIQSFADKRNYDSLMDVLEYSCDAELSIGTVSSLNESQNHLDHCYNALKRVSGNIIKLCKNYGCKDSEKTLYKQAIKAIEQS